MKLAWFKTYSVLPAGENRIVQSWDTANKAKETNDPSVGTTWLETPLGYYLLDVTRGRYEYPELKRTMVAVAAKWKPDIVLIEDKASGQSVIQDLQHTTKLPILAVEPAGDKVIRLLSVSALIESGRVFLPESAPWLLDYQTELITFPNAAHDDQVDSTSQALHYMAHGSEGMGVYGLYKELAEEMAQRKREELRAGGVPEHVIDEELEADGFWGQG